MFTIFNIDSIKRNKHNIIILLLYLLLSLLSSSSLKYNNNNNSNSNRRSIHKSSKNSSFSTLFISAFRLSSFNSNTIRHSNDDNRITLRRRIMNIQRMNMNQQNEQQQKQGKGKSKQIIFSFDDNDNNEQVLVHSIKSPFLLQHDNDNNNDDDENIHVLIILNSPIYNHHPFTTTTSSSYRINPIFDTLWNISSYKVCADGGANRLYDIRQDDDNNDDNYYIPNLIKGDLDSISSNVLEYYKKKGCEIIQDFDQDTNDLDKALQSVCEWWNNNINNNNATKKKKKIQIYIYGAFGGRFDQEMASIQALYKWSHIFDYRVYLYNHETCAWLLKPMKNVNDDGSTSLSSIIRNDIQIPFFGEKEEDNNYYHDNIYVGEGPTCGLIPIGCKCNVVKTNGLKWNLDGSCNNSMLEFGGLVSSSNRVMENVVSIYSSDPLVFTAEIIIKKEKNENDNA